MPRKPQQHPDYVTCRHCGRDFRAITAFHLRNIHGYEGDHPINDYKERFRLRSASCQESRQLISTAKKAFWAKRGQHWTRARVLAEIRRVYRTGRSLRGALVADRLSLAGRRLFGTWQAAVEAAGFNYEKVTGVRHWSPDKVVVAIRELADRGVPLSASYVQAHHPALHKAAIVQFPRSWAKALRAAGFDPDRHKEPRGRWDPDKAADWVRKRAARGRSLLARSAPPDLLGFVYRRLGMSWVDFLESLGVPYPGVKKRRDWTKRKLREEIRRWHAEGHRMNYKAVQREYQALIHQARKYYGSWDRARAAARV